MKTSVVSYLLLRPLGDDSEPVSNHAEDGSEVGKSHQNPEQHDWFVAV